MDVLAQLVVWLNTLANVLGKWLLAPIAFLPGWLSATAVAVVSGILLLLAFKYTSNQRAIKRIHNGIDANLLVLKLFKDSPRVALQSQGHLLVGAGRLFILVLVPAVVLILPVTLILGQLSLWYQHRPLTVGEEAVVTLKLTGIAGASLPEVQFVPTQGVEPTVGPVKLLSKREVCWNIKARANGYHRLAFQLGEETIDKELAVGDGFMRVSVRRPAWSFSDALLHPAEEPLRPNSPVRSIEIQYPARSSWTSGTDWWMTYWFAVSLLAAFGFRRLLQVNV